MPVRRARKNNHRSVNFLKMIAFTTALIIIILGFAFFAATPIQAQCPVCVVTIGGSVLLSRYLGIDDLIVGIWAGGLVLSLGLWTSTLIKKIFIKGQNWLLTAVFWMTTVLGLKQAGFIGNPTCKIHGHDKLLTGIIAGSLVFLLAYALDLILRKLNKKNPGKAFFPYQRVVIPVLLLLIATLIGFQVCRLGIK